MRTIHPQRLTSCAAAWISSCALVLMLSACGTGAEDTEHAQLQPSYKAVEGVFPMQSGDVTICGGWEVARRDGWTMRTPELYILPAMNAELANEPEWRAYSGISNVDSCEGARSYSIKRRQYVDAGRAPTADDDLASPGDFPAEELPKIGLATGSATAESAIYLTMADDSGAVWSCSGTFIHTRVVLTAAHCIVRAGATASSGLGGVPVTVRKPGASSATRIATVFRHANYTGAADAGDDVGLVIFNSSFPNVTAPTATDNNAGTAATADLTRVLVSTINAGDFIQFVGWGNDEFGKGLGTAERYGQAVIDWAATSELRDTVFSGGSRICKGDSGGPAWLDSGHYGLTVNLLGGMASAFTAGSNAWCPSPGGTQYWAAPAHKLTQVSDSAPRWIDGKMILTGIDLTSDPNTACPRYTTAGRTYMRCW